MATDIKPPPTVADAVEPTLTQPRLPRHAGRWAFVVAVGGLVVLHVVANVGIVAAVAVCWLATTSVLSLWSLVVEGARRARDRLVTILVATAFGLAMFPLVSILSTVVAHGVAVLSTEFFTYSMWNVTGEGGGIYHAIMGTLLVTAAATVMSVPVGLLAAIYLIEYGDGGRLAACIRFLVDVMTGIPSIVAGLFAYALFVIAFGPGVRMGFAGAVALSVLMIPVVVRSSEEMLRLVPAELREASYALGVPKWRTVVKVVLPTALAGIVTGITLAIARVVGETAPLLIVAGVTDSLNVNLFDGRMATLPVFAYNSVHSPGFPPEPAIARAWGAALVLIVLVMLLNLIARLVSYLFSPKGER